MARPFCPDLEKFSLLKDEIFREGSQRHFFRVHCGQQKHLIPSWWLELIFKRYLNLKLWKTSLFSSKTADVDFSAHLGVWCYKSQTFLWIFFSSTTRCSKWTPKRVWGCSAWLSVPAEKKKGGKGGPKLSISQKTLQVMENMSESAQNFRICCSYIVLRYCKAQQSNSLPTWRSHVLKLTASQSEFWKRRSKFWMWFWWWRWIPIVDTVRHHFFHLDEFYLLFSGTLLWILRLSGVISRKCQWTNSFVGGPMTRGMLARPFSSNYLWNVNSNRQHGKGCFCWKKCEEKNHVWAGHLKFCVFQEILRFFWKKNSEILKKKILSNRKFQSQISPELRRIKSGMPDTFF